MSKDRIDSIIGQYEDAAARGPIKVQIAFAALHHATEQAAAAGAIPMREGEPVAPSEAGAGPQIKRASLVESATMTLFTHVQDGSLDGQIVNETDLAKRFRVARTTVRQALTILAGAGIVDTSKHPPVFSGKHIPRRRR